MKLASLLFFVIVPFLSARDAFEVFRSRCAEGFGLALEMWRE